MPVTTWYDSDNPMNRRRALILFITNTDGLRGSLSRCERENPGDIWPPHEPVGTGYSLVTARKIARREGLVSEVQS